jgi:hypothetical protein
MGKRVKPNIEELSDEQLDAIASAGAYEDIEPIDDFTSDENIDLDEEDYDYNQV